MLQIQQLTLTKSKYITCEQQQQIHGGLYYQGKDGSHKADNEGLWAGYADGSLNIVPSNNSELITFASPSDGSSSTYSLSKKTGGVVLNDDKSGDDN
ncbi:MAG: hypothetical protein RLZZ381_1489 [Cyanobacteriota bacterium]|jgi:hypothetical protein